MSSMRRGNGVVALTSRRPLSAESDAISSSESESASDASSRHVIENEQYRGNQATVATTSKRRGSPHASSSKRLADIKAQLTPYEMKKAVEKKFRTRYRTLQEVYESRLHALALQVQHAVTQIQTDTTVFCLQENPLTSEFASIRLGEIVHECFFSEREQYIKVVSDQMAWQASDLREVQRKMRDVQQKWKQAQRENLSLQRQLDVRVDELQGQKRIAVQQEERFQTLREEKDALQLELEKAKLGVHSFKTLQREYEALQVRNQNENEREQAAQEKFKKFAKEIEALKAANVV